MRSQNQKSLIDVIIERSEKLEKQFFKEANFELEKHQRYRTEI